jgi:hypothetical protein
MLQVCSSTLLIAATTVAVGYPASFRCQPAVRDLLGHGAVNRSVFMKSVVLPQQLILSGVLHD